MSRVFVNPLTELAEYEELNRDLNRGKGPVQISGCMDSQKVHLMWEAGETLPWMQVLRHLIEEKSGVVVTTIDGLMDHLLPLSMVESQILTVSQGEVIDIEEWKQRLVSLGYERMAQVDGMGQFSIRGGIVDIFPLTEELPVRIELWGRRASGR